MSKPTARTSMWPTLVALPLILLAMFKAAPMALWAWTNRDSFAEASAGEIVRTFVSWPMALGVLQAVAAVWLFVAAWMLLQRRRASRARLIEWSVAAIVLAVVGAGEMVRGYVEYSRSRRELADWLASSPELGEALVTGQPVDAVSVAMLFVLGLLTPALVWWWLRRPRIRAEMAEWGRK